MSDRGSSSPSHTSPARWAVSVVNGLCGDYLEERENGLATRMAFYHGGRPLRLVREAILDAHARVSPKVCVLVHGFASDEGVWVFGDTQQPDELVSYGSLLHADFGYTPFFTRYNTGVAVAENGKRLAALIGQLVKSYPVDVEDIVLIGHSMGGLVIRYACEAGTEDGSGLVQHVRRVFYLGTPHDGAAVPMLLGAASSVLQMLPNPITGLIGAILERRSQGLRDLADGAKCASGPEDPPADDGRRSRAPAGAWLRTARHFLVLGTLTDDPDHYVTALFGDGFVPPPRTEAWVDDEGNLHVPPEQISRIRCSHLALAGDRRVYSDISRWCADGSAGR